MSERRYTDQEVTRLLQRAADLDRDVGGTGVARGLSLAELRDIAAEAGIDPAAVTRAAGELRTLPTSRAGATLLGASPVVRRTAAVAARLSPDALSRLVDVVDDEVPAQGTVGEALGSVRWTSSNRFLSRQVVIQPGDGETVVRVEERFTNRVRGILHGIPATYGGGIALVVAIEAAAAGPGAATAIAVGGAIAGMGLGRALWSAIRGGSRRRVDRLAERLEDEAAELARSEGDDA
ncbi:MAG: hypothetical protein HKN71_05415 [Gemmatimonadetes bacterium]|nr:hypothetical protein [Gemmatimonadota bacterium]